MKGGPRVLHNPMCGHFCLQARTLTIDTGVLFMRYYMGPKGQRKPKPNSEGKVGNYYCLYPITADDPLGFPVMIMLEASRD